MHLSETWLWSRTSGHRCRSEPPQVSRFSYSRYPLWLLVSLYVHAGLPHRGSVSGAESNFAGLCEPNMPWLRRISEATRTPSPLAKFEVDWAQQEFGCAARGVGKTMFDIKL